MGLTQDQCLKITENTILKQTKNKTIILLRIRNVSNYSSFRLQIVYKLIEAGRSEDILQVKGLSTDGLNNNEDTTIQ